MAQGFATHAEHQTYMDRAERDERYPPGLKTWLRSKAHELCQECQRKGALMDEHIRNAEAQKQQQQQKQGELDPQRNMQEPAANVERSPDSIRLHVSSVDIGKLHDEEINC